MAPKSESDISNQKMMERTLVRAPPNSEPRSLKRKHSLDRDSRSRSKKPTCIEGSHLEKKKKTCVGEASRPRSKKMKQKKRSSIVDPIDEPVPPIKSCPDPELADAEEPPPNSEPRSLKRKHSLVRDSRSKSKKPTPVEEEEEEKHLDPDRRKLSKRSGLRKLWIRSTILCHLFILILFIGTLIGVSLWMLLANL